MTRSDETIREFVRNNRDLIVSVLRYSQDSYARACALVLLTHGGTERDVAAIRSDLDTIADNSP